MLALASCSIALALLLVAASSLQDVASGPANASAPQDAGQRRRRAGPSVHETSSSSLYKCELAYLQMDTSLIKFSINHLIVTGALTTADAPDKVIVAGGDNFVLDEINYDATFGELETLTQLDPSLPFIFFINGFNTLNRYGEINGTWMFDVARNLAVASSLERPQLGEQHQTHLIARLLSRLWGGQQEVGEERPSLRANVIFLTWGIPQLLASNLLAMIPAYYKTVANYDLILEFVAASIGKLVEFVEHSRLQRSDGGGAGWASLEERRRYYAQFEFYGHSLGSHILADAVRRVVRQTITPPGLGRLKFGKLTGLDPATPCFLSMEHGISSSKVAHAIGELRVVHSNAGLAGLTSERADVEIVLNGGTFQPGCAWYDFGCHHSRSTDILRYRDDLCQLVAYQCASYHHFKTGACETCDAQPAALDRVNGSLARRNCVLVNMPEQHLDSARLRALARSSRARARRRLAAEGAPQSPSAASARPPSVAGRRSAESATEPQGYHHVSTSAHFRTGRRTHCLQHYQLRLLVHDSEPAAAECSLDKFLGETGAELSLNLFYDDDDEQEEQEELASLSASQAADDEKLAAAATKAHEWRQISAAHQAGGGGGDGARARVKGGARSSVGRRDGAAGGIQMNAIIPGLLHSALLTFEAAPRVFVGGELHNVQLAQLAACYKAANATSGPSLVLDIAFMSHTSEPVRRAFSSLLCGQVDLESARGGGGGGERRAGGDYEFGLGLALCKRAQLASAGERMEQLLEQAKMQRLDDTWRVSLLNNLFSLLLEWEPF